MRRTSSTRHTEQTVSDSDAVRVVLVNIKSCGLMLPLFDTGEIALLEGLTVVYKSNIDLYFYVIGSSHENEVMVYTSSSIVSLYHNHASLISVIVFSPTADAYVSVELSL